MVPEEEFQLVQRAAAGDQTARRALIPDSLIESLFRYAVNQIHSACDAEDLVSDALALVVQKLPDFRGQARFTTWIRGFVDNKILEYRRKRALTFIPTPDEQLDRRPATASLYRDPMLVVLEDEALRQIQMAFLKLNPDEQRAFREYRCHRRSAKAIAAEMSRSDEAVEGLVQRATRKMRDFLADYYAERTTKQQQRVKREAGKP